MVFNTEKYNVYFFRFKSLIVRVDFGGNFFFIYVKRKFNVWKFVFIRGRGSSYIFLKFGVERS